jgi:hypothetical protein
MSAQSIAWPRASLYRTVQKDRTGFVMMQPVNGNLLEVLKEDKPVDTDVSALASGSEERTANCYNRGYIRAGRMESSRWMAAATVSTPTIFSPINRLPSCGCKTVLASGAMSERLSPPWGSRF